MYFANPWGLLALTALPAIVIIHMYHRRFPPLLVAGLHLWSSEVRQPISGRKREPLPISTSLILELLAALLLALVLSQPRFGEVDQVRHVIAVLDGSASMSAVGADGISFRDAAIAELKRRLSSSSRNSVVTVIATGRRPVMLAGPAVAWQVAEQVLNGWMPAAPGHGFESALDMAVQLSDGRGEVLFLTDRLPENKGLHSSIEVLAFGQPLSNVAFIAARWSQNPNTLAGTIFARLANRSPRPAQVRIRGRTGNAEVFDSTLELEANSERAFETPVPGGLGQIQIAAESLRDPLAIDNEVTLIEPKIRSIDLALTLPADDPAFAACRRVLQSVPNINLVSAERAVLIIGTADSLPPSQENLWWLGIGPLDRSDTARKSASNLVDPFIIDRQHPLLDGVLLTGVTWAGVQPVPLDVTPLVSTGKHILLSQLNGTRSTAYLLNIDLNRSDLTDTPDWPILLSNLVELRRDNLPGLRRWNYRLNEEISFRLYEGVESEAKTVQALRLESDGEPKPLARAPLVEVPPLDRAGVYAIRDGDSEFGRFAVNFFDLDESTLTNLRSGRREPQVDDAPTGLEIDRALTWALILGIIAILGLALADWFILRPVRRR